MSNNISFNTNVHVNFLNNDLTKIINENNIKLDQECIVKIKTEASKYQFASIMLKDKLSKQMYSICLDLYKECKLFESLIIYNDKKWLICINIPCYEQSEPYDPNLD